MERDWPAEISDTRTARRSHPPSQLIIVVRLAPITFVSRLCPRKWHLIRSINEKPSGLGPKRADLAPPGERACSWWRPSEVTRSRHLKDAPSGLARLSTLIEPFRCLAITSRKCRRALHWPRADDCFRPLAWRDASPRPVTQTRATRPIRQRVALLKFHGLWSQSNE